MSIYTDFYYVAPENVQRHLKPIACGACKGEGNDIGECETCLRNQADNKEWLETHTFIFDEYIRDYHDSRHRTFKSIPLRLPNEHPLLYYGIELEISFDKEMKYTDYDSYDEAYEETTSFADDVVYQVSEILDGIAVYEWDGSVDDGVEFIFRPCSYQFLTHPDTVAKLKEMSEYLAKVGAYKEQNNGNGFHIHLSKKFFTHGASPMPSSEAYKELDWMFNIFQPELEKLGRRKFTSYCRSKADLLKGQAGRTNMSVDGVEVPVETVLKMKKGGGIASNNHSVAVNQDEHTIELRTFHSTIDYKEILATVEIARALAHASRDGIARSKTLNEILHTKDTMYLDEYIQKVKMACANSSRSNANRFDPLNLEVVNEEEMMVKR